MTDHGFVHDRIGVLGDPHADFLWTKRALEKLLATGVQQIHVLGDFGFVWHGAPKERNTLNRLTAVLATHDGHLYVTGGNHEGYAALQRHYPADPDGYRHLTDRVHWLPRGWRGYTDAGTVVASLGGANSIDRERRTPPIDGHGGSWWPEEQITDADLTALGTTPVDVLLAHDAPRTQALALRLKADEGSWSRNGLAYSDLGQQMFQRGVEQVQPKLVLSGHYHQFLDTTETFHDRGGNPYTTRSVILNCNGFARSAATLEPDTQTLQVLPMV
ncbi:metallophosphoesterase [Curtobacterium sp. MCBD17_040]|uniref:metallophosphoesterase family protein n=1 Tax=Curtobacterium sp. MCBD17_040 TaxID=2175674 RepID=UPI000DA8D603|nr:metallophosphoesterase [Curtobacterium sp. MCBD17_040]WIB65688.1 metallophosphoesterase [Curtobacterium sp. MCBD17_040]